MTSLGGAAFSTAIFDSIQSFLPSPVMSSTATESESTSLKGDVDVLVDEYALKISGFDDSLRSNHVCICCFC